jgi:hypothetical protein
MVRFLALAITKILSLSAYIKAYNVKLNQMKNDQLKIETPADAKPVLVFGWHSVSDRPLFTETERGWVCTDDGDGEFIAAVPYGDKRHPGKEMWWIQHCVVEDETGLCVVGDGWNEPAGYSIEDVTHWMPWPSSPSCH